MFIGLYINHQTNPMRLSILLISVLALTILNTAIYAQAPNYPRNPEAKQLIYSDLINFSKAYALLASNKDTIDVLTTVYFDKGSPGLKEFVNRHGLTPEMLQKAIRTHSERYSKIDNFISTLESYKLDLQEAMATFHKTVPNPMYAPTYLLVGANRGIAQASFQGQLVTVIKVLDKPHLLTTLIVHELAHFQQAMSMGGQKYISLYGKPNNMLELCLREGGAEFITHRVLNTLTLEKGLEYLQKNEQKLKTKFVNDLKNQQSKYWLWESLNQDDHPKLLGYVLGYKVCKAYYELSEDKEQAIKDILVMENAKQFTETSRYLAE